MRLVLHLQDCTLINENICFNLNLDTSIDRILICIFETRSCLCTIGAVGSFGCEIFRKHLKFCSQIEDFFK